MISLFKHLPFLFKKFINRMTLNLQWTNLMLSLCMRSTVESAWDADPKGREMADVENQRDPFIYFKRAYFCQMLKSSMMPLVSFAKQQERSWEAFCFKGQQFCHWARVGNWAILGILDNYTALFYIIVTGPRSWKWPNLPTSTIKYCSCDLPRKK